MISADEYGFYSVYELSQMTGKNYRTLKKILIALQEKNQIVTKTKTGANGKEVTLYNINQEISEFLCSYFDNLKSDKEVLLALASEHIQEGAITTTPSVDDYKRVINEATNARVTIANLNNKITELKNTTVRLEADLKVAQSEVKLLTVKKDIFEPENARLQQELNKVNEAVAKKTTTIHALLGGLMFLIMFVLFTVAFLFLK